MDNRQAFDSQVANGAYKGWDTNSAWEDFKVTGGQKGYGGSAGGGSVNPLPAPPSILEFSDKAYAPADAALKEYVMSLRNQQQPLDVYKQLEDAMGLPSMKKTAGTLREQIGSLEDTIRRVEPNVQATTKESLVTQGQQEGMIAERRRPLMENLGVLGTALGRVTEGISAATADLGTRVSLFMEGQKQALKPFEVQLAAMNDRAARQVTGFSADVENQLSVTMANWERQNELSDQETERAFELLKIEKNYQNTLGELIKKSELEFEQYKDKQPIDLDTYRKQKEIDNEYKDALSGNTDWTKYITGNGSSDFDWSVYGLG